MRVFFLLVDSRIFLNWKHRFSSNLSFRAASHIQVFIFFENIISNNFISIFKCYVVFPYLRDVEPKSKAQQPVWLCYTPLQYHPLTTDFLYSKLNRPKQKVQISLLSFCFTMETLAVGSRQLPSTLTSPPTVSVSGRASSSLALLRATPRVRTLRCSALSSPSLGTFSRYLVRKWWNMHVDFLGYDWLVSEKV